MPSVENPRLVLGLKIRSLRHRRGETLKSLGERSRLSVSYLSEIEKGKKYPKPERLLRLAEALEIPFDELVSLQVADELSPLKAAFNSPLLRGFPFELFGLEPENLISLVTGDPERGSALLRAVAEVGRSYDVHVEHFLLAALRAYQQMHSNYFEEVETEAIAFRRELGCAPGDAVDPARLERVLGERWGVRIDRSSLAASGALAHFRSALKPGPEAALLVNAGLMSSQQAFVLAREVGYRHLELEERALTSPWLEVESFAQVFNNFKASYFAGALLMERDRLRADVAELFAATDWDPRRVTSLMHRYGVTPETFLHRLTQIAPRFFGLSDFFFLRFSVASSEPTTSVQLTKWLNTSRVPVPRGFGLNEHFCRRWPALRLLAGGVSRGLEVVAHRVCFVDAEAEFVEISMGRPMALQPGIVSAVSVGFFVDSNLRRVVRFWDSEALPRLEVNLTCERCAISECADRVADASILLARQAQDVRSRALEKLTS